MDESTSALDTENEERMYRGLKDAGVTFVSIGHRPTLAAFHEECLYLSPGGAWRMADTPKEAKAGAEEGNV